MDQYGDWTMASARVMVVHAQKSEYLTADDILAHLKDPGLDHVRSREEFQSLVREVTAKGAKSGK